MIAEQALADSEARFRALVTASSDVVFRMSADFRELRQLDGRMFMEPSPLPNRDWFEQYVFPADRERVLCTIQDAIKRKRVFESEHRVFRADGTVGWTQARSGRCSMPRVRSSSG